MEENSKWNK